MSQEIVVQSTGEVLDLASFQSGSWLDQYAEGGVSQEEPRLDALATISAGYRKQGESGHAGLPTVSRDGKIYLHDPKGRAPGLKKALEARGFMGLTIAFPFNNPAGFVQQRFAEYSATNLLAHGDEYTITTIDPKTGARTTYSAADDPEGYEAAKRRCKVTISIYFALAEWADDGPRVVFPDGVGLYRIRTTSRNTQRNLRAALESVATWTHGQIAGVPFDTSLDYRDVAGPDGARRNIPCWVFVPRPPGGLTSKTFIPALSQAVHEGRLLQLPPPSAETIETAEWDYRVLSDEEDAADIVIDQPSEREVELIADGGRCDARYWESQWFATVRGTRFASDEARADFIGHISEGETRSLSEWLSGATEQQASDMLASVVNIIGSEHIAAIRERATKLRAMDDDSDPSWQRQQERRAAIEAAGMDTVQEAAAQQITLTDDEYREIADQETEPTMFDEPESAPARETAAEKTKRRREMEQRMAQLLSEGAALDLDLAPYVFDDTTGDGGLEARGVKLAAAIKAKTEGKSS